jgi:agmatine deiminase
MPREAGGSMTLTMPGEWTRHERGVIAWPARQSMWGAQLDAAKDEYAATARAVAVFEPVLMVAAPGAGAEAEQRCGHDTPHPITVVEWPIDDSWTRDMGAIVVTGDDGRRAGVRFGFNAWGEKFTPYDQDAEFAARMDEHVALETIDARPFVLEGGSITVDGTGTLVTTEECLLNPNRNPGLSRHDIEIMLHHHLGVTRVVWLPFGLVEDDDTDGHVDNVAAFVAPNTVVAQIARDRTNPNHERLLRNIEVLDDAGIDVRTIDVLPYATVADTRVVVPPTNLYQANGGVIVPVVAGDEHATHAAVAAVEAVLPDRKVVGVPGSVLAYGGGGVHCITQQVPVA